MSSEQSTPELTTRDVLLQLDRRTELIEGDLRSLAQQTSAGFAELRQEMNARFEEQRLEMKSDLSEVRQEIKSDLRELRRESGTRFNWLVGLVLATWLSTMGTVLFKG